ncbi:hypothetical protein LMG22037_05488 [Paraburkholderia phenoliruptrix]|uniref:Uncharacterized protein n=1 Tax=Paraburkholderia phenoliruptrix TaxID=252970 RepID=A0A6J5C9C2_9BURK|nr:hypothetical protein [Paraburkholderia phenoliruptrix]CAB3729920.1 hypothetical protein LMG22037_05488 [Paraburkholderia phenoliruptrix]
MTDYNETQRKEMLRQMSEQADNSPEAKRKRAIEALGTKYLLHPANRVQRRAVPYGEWTR